MWASTKKASIEKDPVEDFLKRHGAGEVVEELLKELVLNEPEPLEGTVPGTELGVAPFEFLSRRLQHKLGMRSTMDKAVDFVANCNPRAGSVLQDNISEAFLTLCTESSPEESDAGNMEAATITVQALNLFVENLCKPLPESVRKMVLRLVHWPPDHPYLVSYGDFVCTVNPIIAVQELVRCTKEEFHRVDRDEDGFLTLEQAVQAIQKINWTIPAGTRRKTGVKEIGESCSRHSDWMSHAKKIVSALPVCPVPEPSSRELVAQVANLLDKHGDKETDSRFITESVFVDVVVTELSPLKRFYHTWLAE